MRSGNMPKSLYQNWQFVIEVNGFDAALFKKGQEPKTEFEKVAFAPAGSMFDQKVVGRVKFEDIALEKASCRMIPTRPRGNGPRNRWTSTPWWADYPTTTCATSTSSVTTAPGTKPGVGPCTAHGSRSWNTTNSRVRTRTTPSKNSPSVTSTGN